MLIREPDKLTINQSFKNSELNSNRKNYCHR